MALWRNNSLKLILSLKANLCLTLFTPRGLHSEELLITSWVTFGPVSLLSNKLRLRFSSLYFFTDASFSLGWQGSISSALGSWAHSGCTCRLFFMVWLDYDTNDNLSTICRQIVYNLSWFLSCFCLEFVTTKQQQKLSFVKFCTKTRQN